LSLTSTSPETSTTGILRFDGLAKEREVILFNNAGVASSTGDVPTTFAGMAKNAESVHRWSRIAKVDLLVSRSAEWSRNKSRSTFLT